VPTSAKYVRLKLIHAHVFIIIRDRAEQY
jgi:hypothetical protein